MLHNKLFSAVGRLLFLVVLVGIIFFNKITVEFGVLCSILFVYISIFLAFFNIGCYVFVDRAVIKGLDYSRRLKLIYQVAVPRFLVQSADYKVNTVEYFVCLFIFSYLIMPLVLYQRISGVKVMLFVPLAVVVALGAYAQMRTLFELVVFIMEERRK